MCTRAPSSFPSADSISTESDLRFCTAVLLLQYDNSQFLRTRNSNERKICDERKMTVMLYTYYSWLMMRLMVDGRAGGQVTKAMWAALKMKQNRVFWIESDVEEKIMTIVRPWRNQSGLSIYDPRPITMPDRTLCVWSSSLLYSSSSLFISRRRIKTMWSILGIFLFFSPWEVVDEEDRVGLGRWVEQY